MIEEFNSIKSASQKVSYSAHIPYPQPYEPANKFSSNKKSYDVFSPRNSVTSHLWGAFKNRCVTNTVFLKKSTVSEVDPCGGVEKHPTMIRYEINEYILSIRRCPCVVQAYS